MRENVDFRTSDNVLLRGWFYKPDNAEGSSPCLVMAHGFSGTKEMGLDTFAAYFTANLPMACLVYDNRGFGSSETRPGQPRHKIIPAEQISDYSDAITYAQLRPDVDSDKIWIWGSSYSGGHVLVVGATDRRVKTVVTQVPCVDGWASFHRATRADFLDRMNQTFADDRRARAEGQSAGVIPVVDKDPLAPSALPTPDSYQFFSTWAEKCNWTNGVTIKSFEGIPSVSLTRHISPTPMLMTVMSEDAVTPTDLSLDAYAQALESKRLHILPGGHFEAYSGPGFERNVKVQGEFLDEHLCG